MAERRLPERVFGRHPALDRSIVCVSGTTVVVSGPDGRMTSAADGVYVADRRLVSRLIMRVAGGEVAGAIGRLEGAGAARFSGTTTAPTLEVEQRYEASLDSFLDVRVRTVGLDPIDADVEIEVASDLADISQVRSGAAIDPVAPTGAASGVRWSVPASDVEVRLAARPEPDEIDTAAGRLTWHTSLGAGDELRLLLTLVLGTAPAVRPRFRAAPGVGRLDVACSDPRVEDLVRQSIADLQALTLADPVTGKRFVAAGAPWYLTLFGRDALWAARMALPLDPSLATGTLTVLAGLQGQVLDREREEAPGKIVHEWRPGPRQARHFLPSAYYGTVDATPLFVSLLDEARRWGMPARDLAALVPAAEAALFWLVHHADPDGDGFIEHLPTGTGLTNQGWKDSHNAIQHADGRLAEPPIVLCEVQGYAYEAARCGADLLDAVGRPGGDEWRVWAAALAERFRARFWVEDPAGRYPAVALDREKRAVDSEASNMGHLLGTGLLDPDEEALVARRLADPNMRSGWGLRTLSATAVGYDPLSYHAGSVWPHDTAIAAANLARAGFGDAAATLFEGLVAAAPSFDYRLPELFSGETRRPGVAPAPYPGACRPQAWATGAALLMVRTLLGLDVDVPAGTIALAPIDPFPYERLAVRGLRIGAGEVDVVVDHGRLTVERAPDALRVIDRR